MSISNNGVYSLSRDAQDIIAGLKSKLKRTEAALAERTDERDRARNTAVALEQDGAMAHRALMILADAVLDEVDHNTTVYSKALAVKRIGGKP